MVEVSLYSLEKVKDFLQEVKEKLYILKISTQNVFLFFFYRQKTNQIIIIQMIRCIYLDEGPRPGSDTGD